MITELCLGFLVLVFLWRICKKPEGLPPGKWGLPLLGYIPFGGKYIDDQLKDFQKKYGDIYVWRFGTMVQVIAHDYTICRQMFNSPDFINRPNIDSLKPDNVKEFLGIIISNGDIWHTNRRFALRQLRDLGMGKSGLVSAVQEQAMMLVDSIGKNAGEEGQISPALNVAVVNVIWKLVADKQFDSSDPMHKHLQELIVIMNDNSTWAVLADMFMWLKRFIPNSRFEKFFKLDVQKKAFSDFFKYFTEVIEEHQKTLDPDAPRDLLDAFLIEMKEESHSENFKNTMNLKSILFDLFFAGNDTTSGTMKWMILFMASFPDKQRKLQEEIDNVLQKGILATLEDKANMPYTEAVINEVLRKSSLANIGVHHLTVCDTMLAGYKIPKGAAVTSATESIHHDPRYWDEPDRFLPERWLTPDGKFSMKKEGFLPFGTGKRACIGESLSRMEFFIFTTAIFQSFSVTPPEGKMIDLLPNYENAFTHEIRKQEVIFNRRQ